jgi:hypothetical protein
MSFVLIEQLQQKAMPVDQLCRVLEVSRSGYYAARRRSAVPRAVCEASVHLKAAFAASGQAYGSRRLRAAMALGGVVMGRYRVRSLMRQHGLRAVWKRKFVHTTDSRHALPIWPNVLDRQFNPTRSNQAWVADITYIRTRSGWLYLAVVLDLFARKVVGWAMAPDMRATLVCQALQLAIAQRQPAPGLIVHTDRGSQGGFNRLSKHRIVERILDTRSRSQPVSSNPAFCAACCSRSGPQLESLARSSETGRFLWGSIGAVVRSCSRSCRAAMGYADRRRRRVFRTRW